jgi:hypothetical protein
MAGHVARCVRVFLGREREDARLLYERLRLYFTDLRRLSTFVPVTYRATGDRRPIDTCVVRPYLNKCSSRKSRA